MDALMMVYIKDPSQLEMLQVFDVLYTLPPHAMAIEE
jgi:hypothetical protein